MSTRLMPFAKAARMAVHRQPQAMVHLAHTHAIHTTQPTHIQAHHTPVQHAFNQPQPSSSQQGRASLRCCSTSTSAASSIASTGSGSKPSWQIRMLYDGDCPLCMREVDFLKRRDAGKGAIDFVDIAVPDYNPADNAGITFEQAMERIHAVLPDGKVVTDVEVFRRVYEAVGLGWVYAITKVEPVGKIADAAYGVWAKYRTQLTGREELEVILEKRRTQGKMCGEKDAECELPTDRK